MKKPHLTLYGQTLFWFFLNLVLVGGVLFLVLHVQFKVGPWSVFSGQVNQRIEALSELMAAELREVDQGEWDSIVARYDEAYGVTFSVFRPDLGPGLGGADQELPEALVAAVRREFPLRTASAPPERERPGPGYRPPPAPNSSRGPPGRGPELPGPERRLPPGAQGPARVLFYDRDDQSGRYWVALAVPLHSREFRHPPQGILAASADSLGGNDLFFDWRPWGWTVAGALLVSALIWFPFVHRVSRRLRKLTAAAESISEGDFAVQVASGRTDELGRLSRAVQRMAARLDELVAGQKRFLGDIAHELCSPLVRARMSLGILEQNVGEEDRAKLDSITEEVEELSQLVNELLDFSKASLKPQELPREPISMEALARDLVAREATDREVVLLVDPNMKLTTNEGLLRRALGNVLRNAVRYTDPGDQIVLRCVADRTGVLIQVLDRGPGVPEDWVDRIFEPFSRPERARTRETGGSGLGLAIARTCTEALGGR